MKRTLLSLLAVALVAPMAIAQEDAVSFTDAGLDAMPPSANAYADITMGGMRLDGETIRLTIGLTMLPDVTPGMAYLFVFSDGERERFAGVITAPTLAWTYGTWEGDDTGPGDTDGSTGAYAVGPGGAIVADFPLAGLSQNATTIFAPRILTGDIKGGAPPGGIVPEIVYLDTAQGDASLVVRPMSAAPSAEATDPEPASATEPVAPSEPTTTLQQPSRETPAAGLAVLALALAPALALRRRSWRQPGE